MAEFTRNKKQRSGSKSSTQKYNCIVCQTLIDEDKPALKCDVCDNWVCLPCTKLSKTLYLELMSSGDSGIDWLCRVCKTTKSDLKSINTTLLEMKKSNETRLTGVEDRLSHLETNVKVTVREEVELATNNITESVKKDIAETVEKIVESKM